MNWINKTIHLGTVKQNSKHNINFISTKPLEIVKVAPGCAECTRYKSYKNNVLSLVYSTGSLPIQMRHNPGFQDIRKIVVITYIDGSKDILSFTAKIIQ